MKRFALYAFSAAALFGWFVLFGLAIVETVREDVCHKVVSIPYESGSRPLCVRYEQVEQ